MRFTETLVRSRRVFRGKHIACRYDTVRLPDGSRGTREYIEHPGAVAVLPVLPGNRIMLVRQYRFPVHQVTYEIPAGKLEPGERRNLTACVRRELQEETGCTARTVRRLMSFWPTPAFSTEVLHIFIAEDIVRGEPDPDDDEFLDVVEVPAGTALGWVRTGRIRDSKSVIALLWWEREQRGARR
jgi:ADP-ribose pyrophosphatase